MKNKKIIKQVSIMMLNIFLDSRLYGNDSQKPCHSSEGWNPVLSNMSDRNINTSFSVSHILSEIEILRFAQNDILSVTLNEVKGLSTQ
jgi:hypothetical protein